ncbi:MAG TPA: protein-glutamate O-methyltransferase CheR [Candidatus Deferrimicrobium sp.]|nr:protein-glutamate O-methyltransferase CheR [Candidatus Deferrimicrobium sp.]
MSLGSYELFAEYFKHRSGLDLKCYKQTQMQRRIEQFIVNSGFRSYLVFKDSLEKSPELLTSFMRHLTINVSQFFRDKAQWDMLREKILPALRSSSYGTLRIWSAGCSSGQEVYTLAIILQEHFPMLNYTILATDIDQTVLSQAELGIYRDSDLSSSNSLPSNIIEKYFTKTLDGFQVKERLKHNIKFQLKNLLLGAFDTSLDLIVCRNVVIYFTEETKGRIYQGFSESLRTGGVLFTGSTEQIFNLAELNLKGIGPFLYQKQ